MHDDADGRFFLIDAQHIFGCQRLKIQFVRGIVIGRNSFWIAVDHDGFKTHLFQGKRRMDTAIVKFNALTNTVGAAPEDHDFLLAAYRALVFGAVGGIIVGAVGGAADMDGFPGLFNPQGQTVMAHRFFLLIPQFCQIFVGKSVLFSPEEGRGIRKRVFVCQKCIFLFHQCPHLIQKIMFDFCQGVQFIGSGPFADGFIQDKLPFTGGRLE